MNAKYFSMSETIGFEVKSAKDIFAAKELGLFICDENDYYFDDVAVDTDEDGNEIDREVTEDEKTERAIEHLKNGGKVYATFYSDNYMLVDKRATTMQTDFYNGQRVYIMHENKIQELYVQQVIMASRYAADNASTESKEKLVSVSADEAPKRNGTTGITKRIIDKQQNLLLLAKKSTWKHPRYENVECYSYVTFGIYPENEVFTSKEELVKHLMED